MGSIPWVRKIPWRRKWLPTPVILPGESHGQRSLAGCLPWGRQESDITEDIQNRGTPPSFSPGPLSASRPTLCVPRASAVCCSSLRGPCTPKLCTRSHHSLGLGQPPHCTPKRALMQRWRHRGWSQSLLVRAFPKGCFWNPLELPGLPPGVLWAVAMAGGPFLCSWTCFSRSQGLGRGEPLDGGWVEW